VPSAEVPLEDILEFKLKRRDEMLRLREHIDSLVAQMEASPDDSRAWVRASDALGRAIDEQLKAASESMLKTIVGGLEAAISTQGLAKAAFVGVTTLLTGGTPASALANSGGALVVDAGFTFKTSQGREPKTFDYVVSAHNQFGD
jgi:hypothetical protein